MRLLDARRLTGPNVIWNSPCAIVEIAPDPGDDLAAFADVWERDVHSMLDAIDLGDERTRIHYYSGGVALAVSAPVDALYTMVELAEWAYTSAAAKRGGDCPGDFEEQAERLRTALAEERNPALIALQHAAAEHRVAFLWDDDHVSIGLGRGSRTWPVREIPDAIDWSGVHDIPVGLVTGTNGKTTTVRLASRILRKADLSVALSSTDWIGIDDKVIERGDYSGPGGARTALRQSAADAAILETARGGLLRRGLGVERADAALITNIAEDHLGDFGSQSLDELLALKWIVMRALDDRSTAVLNADDARLVTRADTLSCARIWFSLEPDNPVVLRHLDDNGTAFSIVDDTICRSAATEWKPICAIREVPITLDGLARHNVGNALAACALTHALGASDDAIASGLQSVGVNDNPGRCSRYRVRGRDVLVDFAHNPHALASIAEIARRHPAKRKLLCFAQAGDRTDALIRELARGAWAMQVDYYIVSELADYRRGRGPGEVYALLRDELLRCGARADQVSHHDLESESLAEAFERSEPGDLIIMLALADSAGIREWLQSAQEH